MGFGVGFGFGVAVAVAVGVADGVGLAVAEAFGLGVADARGVVGRQRVRRVGEPHLTVGLEVAVSLDPLVTSGAEAVSLPLGV